MYLESSCCMSKPRRLGCASTMCLPEPTALESAHASPSVGNAQALSELVKSPEF